MIGYKAFDENLQCKGFQFEVGKTYDTGAKEDLRLCTDRVFHFCRELHRIENVSDYCISKSRVCEVIVVGDIVSDGDIYGTNKLTIMREIPRKELNEYNSGNSGKYNSGNNNSGNNNSGNNNSGYCCRGNWNSGNCCSGNYNSGDYCSGNWNSGNYNSGDYCSGNYNSGDYCSGNWNSGNYNSGFFNTHSPLARIFNKETNVPHADIDFPSFLYFNRNVWVSQNSATDEEKKHIKVILKFVVDIQRQFLIKRLSVLLGIRQTRKSIENSLNFLTGITKYSRKSAELMRKLKLQRRIYNELCEVVQ